MAPTLVSAGEFKTGLGFEIGPRQQKVQRSPNVHLISNPAVKENMKRDKKRRAAPSA